MAASSIFRRNASSNDYDTIRYDMRMPVVCVKLSAIQGGQDADSAGSNLLGRRQHNDGDGKSSNSSHGTTSPTDSFRRQPAASTTGLKHTSADVPRGLPRDRQVLPAPAAALGETVDDVVVTPQDFLAGILRLAYHRKSLFTSPQ